MGVRGCERGVRGVCEGCRVSRGLMTQWCRKRHTFVRSGTTTF